MTYAIGEIIYGIDLQRPKSEPDPFEDIRGAIEEVEGGDLIETSYNGNGPMIVYFGVCLDMIEEGETIQGADLIAKLTPTADHIKRFSELLLRLKEEPDLYERLKDVEPTVFITWGTS